MEPNDENSAATHFEACGNLMQDGEYDAARLECEAGLAIEPSSSWAHAAIGYCHFRAGQFESSIKEYEAAIGLLPSDPGLSAPGECAEGELQSSLGAALLAQAAKQREPWRVPAAIAAYSRAYALSPDEALGLASLARLLWSRGLKDDAIQTLRRALIVDPGYFPAYKILYQYQWRRLNILGALRTMWTVLAGSDKLRFHPDDDPTTRRAGRDDEATAHGR